MTKQTAIKWLVNELKNKPRLSWDEFDNIIKQSLEIEEEQSREKWKEGWDAAFDFIEYFKKQGLEIRTKINGK